MIKIKKRQIAASAVLISIIAVASVALIISVSVLTRETYGTAAAQQPNKRHPKKFLLLQRVIMF